MIWSRMETSQVMVLSQEMKTHGGTNTAGFVDLHWQKHQHTRLSTHPNKNVQSGLTTWRLGPRNEDDKDNGINLRYCQARCAKGKWWHHVSVVGPASGTAGIGYRPQFMSYCDRAPVIICDCLREQDYLQGSLIITFLHVTLEILKWLYGYRLHRYCLSQRLPNAVMIWKLGSQTKDVYIFDP